MSKALFVLAAAATTAAVVVTAAAGAAPKPRNGKQFFVAWSPSQDATNEIRRSYDIGMKRVAEQVKGRYLFCSGKGSGVAQVDCLSQFLAQNTDAIAVWPVESDTLLPVIKEANKKKIPVFAINGVIPAGKGVTAAVNITHPGFEEGVRAGTALVSLLTKKYGEPKGTVLEIQGMMSTTDAQLRSGGLHSVLDKYPNIEVTSKPADWDGSKAANVAGEWFTAHPDTDAISTASDCDYIPAVQSALEPLGLWKKLGDPKHVIIVGIDGCNVMLNALKCGYSDYTASLAVPTLGPALAGFVLRYLQTGKLPTIGETFRVKTAIGVAELPVKRDRAIGGPTAYIPLQPVTQANAGSKTLWGNTYAGPPNGLSACK